MNYIAHVRQDKAGSWIEHSLEEHLTCVGKLAAEAAARFSASDWARLAGRLHDLGKYNAEFQSYIRGTSGYEAHLEDEFSKGRVDHSTAGAIFAVKKLGLPGKILAYLIAGHHAGLPDWEKDEAPGCSLRERLQRTELLDKTLAQAVPDNLLECTEPEVKIPGGPSGFALWVRMLFSCLVDADFLDTERFMDEEKPKQRGNYPAISDLQSRFNEHMAKLQQSAPDTHVNRLRADILRQCRESASREPGFFSLTVPTGGGKTLSGMAFVLDHAIRHDMRRVIHVIPYTSIIEQTANIFCSIFGDAVIEHHSSLDPDKESVRSRLAAENWDAPIIVTTSVQFFESLFATRTSRCRKLHNLVDSVVVLDEAQLLPPGFLQPTLDALNLLVEHYGVTVVLSTATQPALNTRKDSFGRTILRGLENVREIIEQPDVLYSKLERVRVTLPVDFNSSRNWQNIANEIKQHETVLAIVNTRRHARELHALLPDGAIHLSAQMCGQHRSRVIAGIKEKLSKGEPVRVVSTQLVEAGVDLDFPVVFRALSGLDSIAQAAGRCNREGRLKQGEVVVFVPPEPPPLGDMRRAAAKTVSVLASNGDAPLARDNFTKYFRLFYDDTDLDKKNIVKRLQPDSHELGVQFRTAARHFKLIDNAGENVLVRYYPVVDSETGGQDRAVDALLESLRHAGPNRDLMRRLQRFSVNASQQHFQQLRENGEIEEIHPGIWAQVEGSSVYDSVLGLMQTSGWSAEEMVI